MRAIIKGLKDVYALDLGTTKFCIGRLKESKNTNDFGWRVDTVSIPAEGMRRGMVSNISDAESALNHLIARAEQTFSSDIRKVIVGIAGSHLRGKTQSARINLPHEIVTYRDVTNLTEEVERRHTTGGREVLHTIPLGFSIDGRHYADIPIDHHGKNLEASFFIIDADQSYLRDVLQVCNSAGLQVLRFYSEPMASASVTVPDDLKLAGIAMADIGGGTTDGIVFQRGKPVSIFTINIGGRLMTNDLSIGLSLPLSEAEKAKIYFGIPIQGLESQLCLTDISGNSKVVYPTHINAVLLPRVHELGVAIAKALMPFRGALGAGLFLTGGGSEVKGLPLYYKEKMGISVHIACPKTPKLSPNPMVQEQNEAIPQSPKLATVLGLLNLEIGRIGVKEKYSQANWSSKYLGPILNWLKEMT